MILELISLVMSALEQQGSARSNPLVSLLPFLLIILIMYFLIFRPQSRRQKQHRLMIDALKKGDKILTAGGIFGTIEGVNEKEGYFIVKIDDNVKVRLARGSVARKLE